MPELPINFKNYLEHIARSREKADAVLKIEDLDSFWSAALMLAWERLFDALANEEDMKITDISSIIQRLMSSNTARKTLEIKQIELEEKIEEREQSKNKLKQTIENAKNSQEGLTTEFLKQIEEELNLL